MNDRNAAVYVTQITTLVVLLILALTIAVAMSTP